MSGERAVLWRSIEALLQDGAAGGVDDGALLERFAVRRDGEALAALVEAHGPMVLGVCRRVLRLPQDIDDAFQSTFLVLARRAGTIRDPGRLGPWLHGVAWRVASRARSQARGREPRGEDVLNALESRSLDPQSQAERNELAELIDGEVDQLPPRYREVIVLCDLEGRSYADAARQLRCPLGTIQSRLARGRDQLRARLARLGVTAGVIPGLPVGLAPAPVPAALAEAMIRSFDALSESGAMAGAGTLMIQGGLRSPGAVVPRIAVAVLMALGTCLAVSASGERRGEAPPPTSAIAPHPAKLDPRPVAPPEHERTILLEVRAAAENRPLAGAAVRVEIQGGRSQKPSLAHTGDDGRYLIELPEGAIAGVVVAAGVEGFVPKVVHWSGTALPDHPIVGLERGVPISGTVVDEQGKPIEAAQMLPGNAGEGVGEVAPAVTDAQGRWRSSALVVQGGTGRVAFELRLRHPDYVTVRHHQQGSLEELRRQPLVLVMKHGAGLSGRVTGPDGRPVAGALVVADQQGIGGSRHETRTDASGAFRFGRCLNPDESSAFVAVQAPGLAAHARELLVTPGMPAQSIALERPRPLLGLVVDARGRPVAGAAVSPTTLATGRLDWGAVTDAEGRFAWADAPTSGTIVLDIYHSEYEEALGRNVEAVRREVTITLHRPLHLHGTVTDAATGRPVERFALIPGWGPHRPGAQVTWLREDPSIRRFTQGLFDLSGGLFPDQGFKRSIRIEADGYAPAELIGFRDDAEEIAHDFKLVKAAHLSGIVRGPDGRALAGAMVGLSGPGNDLRIVNGRLQVEFVGAFAHTRTGPDGHYSFPPQENSVTVVAVHDTGFAMRSPEQLAAGADLNLSPWGVIEGVLKVGRHAAPKQRVNAFLVDHSFYGRVDYKTTTDDQGRFRLEHVTPGLIEVYREVTDEDSRGWTASNPTFVELGAGQHVTVQVGGTGRPVAGRLQVPQGFSLADLVSHESYLTTTRRGPHQPDDFPDYTFEQQYAWYDRFYRTPEGKVYCTGERQYAVAVQRDGTFRAEDVPPGEYEVQIHFRGRDQADAGGLFAAAHGRVTVPPIPGGRSDQPLDGGTFRLEVIRLRDLKVGDTVPAVTRNLPDGRPLDLATLRGKFVLLHFWETYQAGGVADLPALKEVWEAFRHDPRFVMISLNQDADFDLPRRYAARKGLGWEQRHAGLERPNPITAAFGVRFPPKVLLIGPDGRLVATDLQGGAIKNSVARALGAGK
jgi:RNA polymerase sigma factor (sigma-70 family)